MKVRHSALVLLCGLAAVVLFGGGSHSTVFAGEDASYKLAYDLKPGTVYVLTKKLHAGTEGASPRGQVQSETSGEWNVYLIPVELPGGGKKVIVRSERARIGVDKYVVGGMDMTLQAKLSASMQFAKYPRSGMEIFSADEAGAYFTDKMFRDMPLYTATASMAALSLPAKEMKVGDTWEEKRDLAKGFAVYKFRFDGVEEKAGEKCMAISATYILTGSDGSTIGDGGSKLGVKVWVSLEGYPVAAEGVSEIIVGPQSKTTETFTLTLKEKKNITDDKAILDGYITIAQMLTELGTLDAVKNPGSLKSACEYRDKLAKEFANHPLADKAEERFKAGLLEEIKALHYAVLEQTLDSYGKERSENLSVAAQKYISDEKISARSLNALTTLSIAGVYEGFPEKGLEYFSTIEDACARADLALLAGRQKKFSDEAKQTLLLASIDKDATTRQVAARYLARLADEDSAKLLISLLGDKTESVKENALESLKAISGKDFGFDAGKWEEWLKGGPKMKPADVPGYETDKLSRLVSQYLRAEEKERSDLLKKIEKESKSSYKAVQEALVEKSAYLLAPVGSLGMLEVRAEGRGKGAEYALYVPHNYRPDRPYPVMIMLVGGTGEGDEDFVAEVQRHTGADYIVIAPSSRSPQLSLWWDEGKFYVMAALKEVISRYNVDTDRVFIGGHSNGGIGCWHIAYHWPHVFAGVCPNAGYVGGEGLQFAAGKDLVGNLVNLPFLVQHGETDRIIPAANSKHFVDMMKEMGCDVEYIVYPKLGHGFSRRPDGLNEQFYKMVRFADVKRRKAFPKHVYFKSPLKECTRAYWIEFVPSGDNPTVEAEVTKDNVIDIKARDVSNITLYLGDELLDLDKKVTINLNGEKALEKKFKRSIETLLDTAIAAGDRKLATPVKVEIAVASE
ncbi:MAG: prolyl oligopeptidase family serine peptidase [Planctomycetota bacterium]